MHKSGCYEDICGVLKFTPQMFTSIMYHLYLRIYASCLLLNDTTIWYNDNIAKPLLHESARGMTRYFNTL